MLWIDNLRMNWVAVARPGLILGQDRAASLGNAFIPRTLISFWFDSVTFQFAFDSILHLSMPIFRFDTPLPCDREISDPQNMTGYWIESQTKYAGMLEGHPDFWAKKQKMRECWRDPLIFRHWGHNAPRSQGTEDLLLFLLLCLYYLYFLPYFPIKGPGPY